MDFTKHLETLGLEPGASPEEVQRAFRERMAAWDPDRGPDSPSFRKDSARARRELEAAYRFLMNRYGVDPVDLEDSVEVEEEEPSPPPPSPRPKPRKAGQPAKSARVPVVRMIVITASLLAIAVVVVPAIRDPEARAELGAWGQRALQATIAKLATWLPEAGTFPTDKGAAGDRRIESLPRLTKKEVLQRYGEPHSREAGRWVYSGFVILFQDDSIASLLVRDTAPPR